MLESDRPQITKLHGAENIKFACKKTRQEYRHALKLFNTYCSSVATMLSERASMLLYKYIACLVIYGIVAR